MLLGSGPVRVAEPMQPSKLKQGRIQEFILGVKPCFLMERGGQSPDPMQKPEEKRGEGSG